MVNIYLEFNNLKDITIYQLLDKTIDIIEKHFIEGKRLGCFMRYKESIWLSQA